MRKPYRCCALMVLLLTSTVSGSVLDDKGEKNDSYVSARKMMEQENWTVAAALLQMARKDCPGSLAVLTASAQVARGQKNSAEAVAFCLQALRVEMKQRKIVQALRKNASPEVQQALARRRQHLEAVLAVLRSEAPEKEALYRHARALHEEGEAMPLDQRKLISEAVSLLARRLLGDEHPRRSVPAGGAARPENGPLEHKPPVRLPDRR